LFMDPRRGLKAFGAVIVGVVAYCVLVAPLVHEGRYSDVGVFFRVAFWPVWLIRIVVMPGSLFTHVPECTTAI